MIQFSYSMVPFWDPLSYKKEITWKNAFDTSIESGVNA